MSEVPNAYRRFVERYPKAGEAWDTLREGEDGPLDSKQQRLVKLGIALAREAEGASHSAARKAIAAGATLEEMEQVVALATSTIGFPASVKAYGWVLETWESHV
jgi:alkylhydroperoxidase/carboxymuconolactone decarboxylase family protein YurZ